MIFDLEEAGPAIAYKLLVATVVPRPIAWLTTMDGQGRVNAAPFSFFNIMGSAPPVVAIGIQADEVRGFKDTVSNIFATGEFVVNLVPMRLVKAMNLTSLDAPTGIDELQIAGLERTASHRVKPPRIAQSPVALECVNHASMVTGPHQTIVVGRVLAIHVDDRHILDASRGHVDTPGLDLVGRMFGANYVRTHDRFALDRPDWASWTAANVRREGKMEE